MIDGESEKGAPTRLPKWEHWRSEGGDWRFQLIGANGEPMGGVSGQGYRDATDCVRGIEDFKSAAAVAVLVKLPAPPNRRKRRAARA